MSGRKFSHLGKALAVRSALVKGGKIKTHCGRRIRPLPADVAKTLPPCPMCAAIEERDRSAYVRVWRWSASTEGKPGAFWGAA